jgi:hypothetical protein
MFTVERRDGTGITSIDVTACGNGQYGGLGSGAFTNAQSTPSRVKNVSGLLECMFSSFPFSFPHQCFGLDPVAQYVLASFR